MRKIEVVSASAGSGKTSRIARELRERVQSGQARPEAVLATTFTNKAADELKERARTELFRAGLHDEALRLEGARIGTVNSVCGRLVADFALELGLSPELRVIDEDQAAVALRRVISRVITDSEREQLSALAGRFDEFDWQRAVERLLVYARTNLLTDADLQASADRSLTELLAHLPNPQGIAEQRDLEFSQVIEQSLEKVDPKDDTKSTRDARSKVQEALSALRGGPAPWKLWAKAMKATAGKKSDKSAFDPIRAVAAQVDTHPRLREDLTKVITLVFALTRRTFREWQSEKRELGVLDFVDQETLALDLLKRREFADRIAEQVDLVLIDEFQDTSPLQLELFTRLAALAKDSLWVGDQKQAIFGFRGTDPALMDAALESVLEGREPETLGQSFRSRAPLVELTSSLFAKAFAPHGLPEQRVRLVAANPDDARLGACLESWAIEGKNRAQRLASLADGIVRLLADPTMLVRDRADGSLRRPTAGDLAVLCRKNADCQQLAQSLAGRGLSATVRQESLLSTPEARAAVLALRLFIDARDRLAAAELARLLLHPDDPDGWLGVALENAGEVPFEAAAFHAALQRAREQFPAAGPLASLDAAVDGLELREVLPRWGDSSRRHANLDALRGHAVDYVARADADGSAATPAGLVAYFDFIEGEGLDSQATLPGADSVVVSTWHAAKGLEWPVTVLALVGSERNPPRFGFSVRSTKQQFSLENPLEGRWVRYWPNPFHPSQTTELRRALESAPEAGAEKAEADKQELRLLYVGWTRARDRLVLAHGDGGWMLDALEPPTMPETSGTIEWAGVKVDVQVRESEGVDAGADQREPDDAPVAGGPVEYPPAFISPSTIERTAVNVEVTVLGDRLLVMGEPDMNELGQALHGFLAADRPSLPRPDRVRLAAESLSQWGQSGSLRPERMVDGSDTLLAWGQKLAPSAAWHRELPVDHLLPEGSLLRGIADLVLEDDEGFWLIDHKSYPGSEQQGIEKAKTFAGQLEAYARALETAWAKPCLGMFVHLAVLQRLVRLVPTAGQPVQIDLRSSHTKSGELLGDPNRSSTMPLASLNQPRASVFEKDRRATVLNLDNFLAGKVPGEEFFKENYFTVGMLTLVDRCFRQLGGGNAGSSVFLLSQAMGGGKTHSMVSLGLMARDPVLRKRVMATNDPAPSLGKVKVIGFNGRNVEPAFGVWGSLAEQLGRRDNFRNYYQPLSAPGPQAWKELLEGQPVIVLLDELPPYMEHARSVQVGNSDLAVVTAAALANLLIAASEMDSVCVVISDLGGANWQAGGDMIQHALSNLKNEARRSAVPITPVNPQGDELYHILRCRLFEKLPGRSEIEKVADAYRKSHAEAVQMGLTTTQSDGLYQQILDSYPFHPSWRDLVGRFKENDGFQQTRGVIRLMQMVISKVWTSGRADSLELLHPYDIDLNDAEVGSEVRTISPHLSEAVAHDIAHSGQSEAEAIDAKNRNTDATDATRLILLASLSTTPGAVHGLREFEVYDFLQRPGRDLSSFKANVLDLLDTRAWYLHRSPDGRLFFKNQQNLAAKLRSTAQALNNETVLKELRKYLEDRFAPVVRDAYQFVAVLPALDEVQVEQDKVVLVLAEPSGGHAGLPISQEWQGWWTHQSFKNRVIFLTGSRMVMQNVNDSARQVRALKSIEDELNAESTPANDPQWRALDGLKDRLLNQLSSALTQAFDTLVFPSINDALRSQAISLEFRGNNWHGEDVVRRTLEAAQKFTADVGADGFRLKAEARLFTAKSTLWSEVRRKAATTTTWPFHAARALDDLKAECIRKDLWREQGQYIEKGPFPKPETSVAFRELSRDDDGTAWLRIEPLHGDTVYFETGTNKPTTASSKVADFQRFEAKQLRYQFLCIDSTGEHPAGEPKEWHGRIELRYSPQHPQAGNKLELRATPKGDIRYSTDGTSPESGATYQGPFVIPDACRIVLGIAEADGIKSEVLRVSIQPRPGKGSGGGTRWELDPRAPCRWKKQHKLDDTASVWAFVERLEKHAAKAHTLTLTAETDTGDQTVEFNGATEQGYAGRQFRGLCDQAQALVGGQSGLRVKVLRVDFETGQQLLDWLQASGQVLNPSEVEQERRNG